MGGLPLYYTLGSAIRHYGLPGSGVRGSLSCMIKDIIIHIVGANARPDPDS